MFKTEKGKIEKDKNNTSCIFSAKPYVKNDIFGRKTILEKNFRLKKTIKLKILHEIKLQNLKNG